MAGRLSTAQRVVVSIAVALCAFGVFESVDAAVGLFRPMSDEPLAALFDYPLWALMHFVPGALWMALAPLQLWAGFRSRHRTVHRWTGRVVVTSALVLAVSGMAFPFTMPQRTLHEQVFMTLFGVGFFVIVVNAFAAARRRDFTTHRVWMIRMFAFGLTITTQRLLIPVFFIAFGITSVEQFWQHFMSAAWTAQVLQVAAGEWWIRKTRPVTASKPSPAQSVGV